MDKLKLWDDLFDIISEWLLEHPECYIDEVVDDLHDYIIDNYGPPF